MTQHQVAVNACTVPPTRACILPACALALFIATHTATPAHAQVVAPDSCTTPAQIEDDGDGADMITDEGSVAVGCGSKVRRNVEEGGDFVAVDVPLLTLDAGADGDVDIYLLKLDCDSGTIAACGDRTGDQYADIGEALHTALSEVAPDSPLTEDEIARLGEALASIEPLGEIVEGLNELVATPATIDVAVMEGMEEVAGGVAVGADANVKANGGIAIGNGATVGMDITSTPRLIFDETGTIPIGAVVDRTGGGGVNGIAIGNGAMAMGEGSIAIGGGAMATEDGQVVIGGHDIGAMHDDVMENAAGVLENAADIEENAAGIATNAAGVADNRTMIGANGRRLDGHDADLAANRNQLNQHAAMLSQHADGIRNNAMQIKMLDERVNQVAAMAAALSAVPNAPDRDERFFLGIGMGSHDGESGLAAGLAGRLGADKNIVINAGVANSGGETTVRAGIGWSF